MVVVVYFVRRVGVIVLSGEDWLLGVKEAPVLRGTDQIICRGGVVVL